MDELKQKLSEALNLDDDMAQKGVETVTEFLKSKLPESMHGILDNFGGGEGGDAASNALDAAKGLFGGK